MTTAVNLWDNIAAIRTKTMRLLSSFLRLKRIRPASRCCYCSRFPWVTWLLSQQQQQQQVHSATDNITGALARLDGGAHV